MKRTTTSVVAILTLVQSMAQAQLMDLPDPGDAGGSGSIPSNPQKPATNPAEEKTQYAGSARISKISRKTGGVLYTVKLEKALGLLRVDLRVVESKVKIHEATLVTDYGQRIEIRQYRGTAVLETGSLTTSEALNPNDKIASIEILAESYSAEADVIVTAVAKSELPKLSVKAPAPVVTPPPVTQDPVVTDPGTDPVIPGFPGFPDLDPTYPGDGSGQLDPYVSFQPNERVLYDGRLMATVVRVYGRQVEVYIDGRGNQVVESYLLEKATRCVDDICQNDSVQYGNESATVLNVFVSGRVLIAMKTGARYIVDSIYLSKGLQCDKQNLFCVGDAVLYQNQYPGMVTQIYDNGMLQISLNGYNNASYTVAPSQLANALVCSEGALKICVNERVIYQNRNASVRAVYSNGLVSILVDGQRNIMMVPINYLSKRLNCYAGFCVGHKVYYGKDKATIKEIYSNGTALIKLNGLLNLGKDYIVNLSVLRF